MSAPIPPEQYERIKEQLSQELKEEMADLAVDGKKLFEAINGDFEAAKELVTATGVEFFNGLYSSWSSPEQRAGVLGCMLIGKKLGTTWTNKKARDLLAHLYLNGPESTDSADNDLYREAEKFVNILRMLLSQSKVKETAEQRKIRELEEQLKETNEKLRKVPEDLETAKNTAKAEGKKAAEYELKPRIEAAKETARNAIAEKDAAVDRATEAESKLKAANDERDTAKKAVADGETAKQAAEKGKTVAEEALAAANTAFATETARANTAKETARNAIAEKDAAVDRATESESKLKAANDERDTAKKAVADGETAKTAAETKLVTAEEAKQAAEEDLAAENEKSKNAIAKLEKDIEEQRTENTKLEIKLDLKDEEIKNLNTKLERQNKEIVSLRDQLKQANKDTGELSRIIAEMEINLAALEKEKTPTKEKIDKAVEAKTKELIEKYELQLAALREEKNTLNAKVTELKEKLRMESVKAEAAEAKAAQKEQQAVELFNKLNKLKERREKDLDLAREEAGKAATETAEKESARTIAKLEKRIDALNWKISELEEKFKKEKMEHEIVRGKAVDLEGKNEKLRTDLREMREAHDKAQLELSEANRRIANLESMNEKLETHDFEGLTKKIRELEEDIERWRRLHEDALEKSGNWEARWKENESALELSIKENAKLLGDINRLMQEAKKWMEAGQEGIQKFKKDAEDWERVVDGQVRETAKLEVANTRLNEQIKALEKELKSLRSRPDVDPKLIQKLESLLHEERRIRAERERELYALEAQLGETKYSLDEMVKWANATGNLAQTRERERDKAVGVYWSAAQEIHDLRGENEAINTALHWTEMILDYFAKKPPEKTDDKALRSEIKSLRTRATKSQKALERATREWTDAQNAFEFASEEITRLETELAQSVGREEAVNDLTAKLRAANQKLDSEQTRRQITGQKNAALHEDIEGLTREKTAIESRHESALRELQESKKSEKTERELRKTAVTAAAEAEKRLSESAAKAKKRLGQSDSRAENYRLDRDILDTQLKTVQREITELQKTIQTEKAGREDDHIRGVHRTRAAEEKTEKLNDRIQTLERELEGANQEKESAKKAESELVGELRKGKEGSKEIQKALFFEKVKSALLQDSEYLNLDMEKRKEMLDHAIAAALNPENSTAKNPGEPYRYFGKEEPDYASDEEVKRFADHLRKNILNHQ